MYFLDVINCSICSADRAIDGFERFGRHPPDHRVGRHILCHDGTGCHHSALPDPDPICNHRTGPQPDIILNDDPLGGDALVHKGAVRVVIPLRGWSSVDAPGNPTHDTEEDRIFADALKERLKPGILVLEVDANMEDPEFAAAVVGVALEVLP